jgi:uncharacterized protein YqjF (DUF2071 family)
VWVGLLSLEVAHARLPHLAIPGPFGRFREVDFVTYVTYEGRNGVFFISIESAHRWLALVRWTVGLPYLYSGLRAWNGEEGVHVRSGPRPSEGAPPAMLDLRYRPVPGERPLDPTSPAVALLEQYSAFVVDRRGRICELDEVHAPWNPVPAEVEVRTNTIGDAVGIDLPVQPTLAHHAKGRRILTWAPKVVTPGRAELAPTAPRR